MSRRVWNVIGGVSLILGLPDWPRQIAAWLDLFAGALPTWSRVVFIVFAVAVFAWVNHWTDRRPPRMFATLVPFWRMKPPSTAPPPPGSNFYPAGSYGMPANSTQEVTTAWIRSNVDEQVLSIARVDPSRTAVDWHPRDLFNVDLVSRVSGS